ncbi:MAG: 16S rRNA (cytosine(1402)-N(4))-methyltransferase RsmH [Alphaproteobacteria bacterium]
MNALHVPVMLNEVLEALSPQNGGRYVDGTFGAGGYTRAILDAADCSVAAIDRDPEAVARGTALAGQYGQRLTVLHGRFGDMQDLLRDAGVAAAGTVDGVVFDLGVSSPQIDDASRGFSFRFDGPLDMRMGRSGPSAADIVNTLDERALADLIFQLGEERRSRQVARAIVTARRKAPLARTAELAAIVRTAVPAAKDGLDPATRTFMALRLYVNDELGELDRGLAAAEAMLKPGGRLAVVSFHSLEDRRVKAFLADRTGSGDRGSRHRPAAAAPAASFRLVHRRALRPTDAETRGNPRARSARLRVAERIAAPDREARA